MTGNEVASRIESEFRGQVRKSKNPRNAYLRVRSKRIGVDLNIAEGKTGKVDASTRQPVHLASVGKLFTSTIVSILSERRELAFSDPISRYLDADLMAGLHVLRGTEYSGEIQIRHLLNQTSGLNDSFWQGYSEPKVASELPPAGLFIDGVDYSKVPGFAEIDYAGGGVRATLDDFLTFMTALVNHKLVGSETLNTMMSDDVPSMPGMRYGYAIWKFVTVPIVAPAKFNCWGCVGVTGAFMFFHPRTESYIIGSFNDMEYKSKALRFMLSRVINQLLKCE